MTFRCLHFTFETKNNNGNNYDSFQTSVVNDRSTSNYQDQFRFNNDKVVVYENNQEDTLPEDDETSVEEPTNQAIEESS